MAWLQKQQLKESVLCFMPTVLYHNLHVFIKYNSYVSEAIVLADTIINTLASTSYNDNYVPLATACTIIEKK